MTPADQLHRPPSRSSLDASLAAPPRETGPSRLQELKFSVHRNLLERINLEALGNRPPEQARQEVKPMVGRIVGEEKTPLSFAEKEQLIEEVLDEVFGLGPLEPLLRDRTVSDILVTTPRMVYIERAAPAPARQHF